MKKFLLVASAALTLLAVTSLADAGGEWLRAGNVWFKGLVYNGTSKVQLTNAAGNVSTTTGTFSGAVSASGITNTGNSTVTGTLAVTGATALRGVTTFSSSVNFASAVTGVTAATSGTFGGSPIAATTSLVEVGTVGSSGDSVTLPTGITLGKMVVVSNKAASNALNLFAPSGGYVNNKAQNGSLQVVAGKAFACYATDPAVITWACVGP